MVISAEEGALDTNDGVALISVLDDGPITLQLGANEGQTIDVRIPELNLINCGINSTDMTTEAGAKKAIDEILNKLSPRERQVLIMHFGLCGQEKLGLEEISKEMNITTERVRQIESLALNKIRGMNGSNRLRNFIKL